MEMIIKEARKHEDFWSPRTDHFGTNHRRRITAILGHPPKGRKTRLAFTGPARPRVKHSRPLVARFFKMAPLTGPATTPHCPHTPLGPDADKPTHDRKIRAKNIQISRWNHIDQGGGSPSLPLLQYSTTHSLTAPHYKPRSRYKPKTRTCKIYSTKTTIYTDTKIKSLHNTCYRTLVVIRTISEKETYHNNQAQKNASQNPSQHTSKTYLSLFLIMVSPKVRRSVSFNPLMPRHYPSLNGLFVRR